MYKSDSPLVFCQESQIFRLGGGVFGGMNWLKTSISPNRPGTDASGVLANPASLVATAPSGKKRVKATTVTAETNSQEERVRISASVSQNGASDSRASTRSDRGV